MNPVEIRSPSEAELALWRATAELATALPRGSWTLVGAQMVFLIAYEHDLPIGRTSGDIDLMMDIRALTDATQKASTTLENLGYELDPPTPDGRAHRFRRGDDVVDVLAPDGAGPRASLLTIPPGRSPWLVDRRPSHAADRSGCDWRGEKSNSPVLPCSERSWSRQGPLVSPKTRTSTAETSPCFLRPWMTLGRYETSCAEPSEVGFDAGARSSIRVIRHGGQPQMRTRRGSPSRS